MEVFQPDVIKLSMSPIANTCVRKLNLVWATVIEHPLNALYLSPPGLAQMVGISFLEILPKHRRTLLFQMVLDTTVMSKVCLCTCYEYNAHHTLKLLVQTYYSNANALSWLIF